MILYDALWSSMVLCAFLRHRVVDALHGGEMAADDALRCLHPLSLADSERELLPRHHVAKSLTSSL